MIRGVEASFLHVGLPFLSPNKWQESTEGLSTITSTKENNIFCFYHNAKKYQQSQLS